MFGVGADLGGLLNSTVLAFNVAEVVHKATIEINEEHTEATAVTSES